MRCTSVFTAPPPGSYPNSIAVGFQPGANVTVHYRVNLGTWQQGTGPVWIAQNAAVEFYGEHVGGSLSPIQSAAYIVDQAPDADGDGDGVPDAIEELVGTNLTKADTDGAGDSDFAELLDGSDPNDPASRAGPHVRVFDSIAASFVWDDDASAVISTDDQEMFISDPAKPGQASAKVSKVPGMHRVGDITLKRGVIGQRAWFPAGYAVERSGAFGPAMTSLVGVEFPPVPNIQIDLNAADPVADWRAAAELALDDFHAVPLEFTVGPSSALGALIIEYWYGTQLLQLGRIASLAERPRLADSPNSPQAGFMNAADITAIQEPATLLQPGHELAQVWQQLNTALQQEPSFAPLRQTAEAAFAQAMRATRNGAPLDSPVHALRNFISGEPVPAGYLFPIVQATAINLRGQLLALVDPRPQVELTGTFVPKPGGAELLVAGDGYDLLIMGGEGWHPTGHEIIVPGSILMVRGFPTTGTPAPGLAGAIAVLAVAVLEVPEAGYADLDGNGLPDAWEQFFLGSVGSPLGGDTAGDGFLDPEELGAGTDPTNPLLIPTGFPATPREMRVEFTPGVGPSIMWDGSTTVDYEVWMAAGFFPVTEWNPLAAPVLSSGPQRHVAPIDASQAQQFYRVQIKFPWLE